MFALARAVLSLLVAVSSAQMPVPGALDLTNWKDAPPPAADGPRPGTPEGGYTDADEVILRDRKDRGVLDQLCRNIRLNVSQDFSWGGFGIGGSLAYSRRLRQLHDGRQGLLETLHVDGRTTQVLAQEFESGAAHLSVSAAVVGESSVMRPLKGTQTCAQVLHLFTDFKTAFPFTAERISEMKVGELWKLPLRITVGAMPAVSAGDQISPDNAASTSLTFGGFADDGSTSVTLYRLSQDKVRFRFRLENAVIHTKFSASGVVTFPLMSIASVKGGMAGDLLTRQVNRQMRRYIEAMLAYSDTDTKSDKAVLELILDPNDKQQMEGLVELVKGDMFKLFKLLAQRGGILPNKNERREAGDLAAQYVDRTKAKAHGAFSNRARVEADGFAVKLPLLFQGTFTGTRSEDRMARIDGAKEEVRVHGNGRSDTKSLLDVIFLGPFVRDYENRQAQSLTKGPRPAYKGAKPESTLPGLIYLQQEAFWRIGEQGVRYTAGEFAGVTQRIDGKTAGGVNWQTRVPAPELLPAPLPEPPAWTEGGPTPQRAFRTGTLSLALYVTPEGVQKMISADRDAVIEAFASTLDKADAEIVRRMTRAGITKNELMDEARAAVERFFGTVPSQYYLQLAEKAVALAADVARVRNAETAYDQSVALSDLVGGRGGSKLSYEHILKILLQFVPADQVKGDYRYDIQVSGKEKVAGHKQLNGGIDSDPFVKEVAKLREAFAPPTDTKD